MPKITGYFDARRPAEVVVEHLVQDHGLDRKAVTAMAEGEENSSGTVPSGNDAVAMAEGEDPGGKRAGRIVVTAEVPDDMMETAMEVFRGEGASEVRTG